MEPVNLLSYIRNFAEVIKIMNLKTGRLFCITCVVPISSHESLETFLSLAGVREVWQKVYSEILSMRKTGLGITGLKMGEGQCVKEP